MSARQEDALENKAIDRVHELLESDIFTYNDCACVTLSDAEECYFVGYQDAIKKACEWIERFAYNSVITDNIGEREKQAITIAFKEAMEERQ